MRDGWGGDAARWLGPGVAAEFDLDRVPDSRRCARPGCAGVDLNVVAAAGREKRLLLADMDSTMIEQECIDELADVAGVGGRVAAITARAMNGKIGFEGALRERVGVLAGLDAARIERVIAERITMMPGGAALVATMKADGARAALVSGGFTAFTGARGGAAGVRLEPGEHAAGGGGPADRAVAEPILGRAAKVAALEELVAEKRIAEEDVLAVGDGANDLGMLGRRGWAWRCTRSRRFRRRPVARRSTAI